MKENDEKIVIIVNDSIAYWKDINTNIKNVGITSMHTDDKCVFIRNTYCTLCIALLFYVQFHTAFCITFCKCMCYIVNWYLFLILNTIPVVINIWPLASSNSYDFH